MSSGLFMPSARCLIHKEKFFAPCSQMPLLWGLCTSFVSGKDTRKSCEQSDALADAATRSRTWTCGFGGHRAPSGTPLRRGKCFRWVVVDQGEQKVQHYFFVLYGPTGSRTLIFGVQNRHPSIERSARMHPTGLEPAYTDLKDQRLNLFAFRCVVWRAWRVCAGDGIRTRNLLNLSQVPLPIGLLQQSIRNHRTRSCAVGGIRTHNLLLLKQAPLPIGSRQQ